TGGPCPVSSAHLRRSRGGPTITRAVADQVVAGHPAPLPPLLPVAGVLRAERGRVLRDPLHRPLPAHHLRLQRRRHAVELAGQLLLLRGARHRPLPAVLAPRRPVISGPPRGGLPGAA